MTISRDLYLSILSMDAYNRGYAPGIVGLGGLEAGIGNASISNQSDINGGTPGVNAGFYAIAYDDPTYGTIISYRGTDDYDILPCRPTCRRWWRCATWRFSSPHRRAG